MTIMSESGVDSLNWCSFEFNLKKYFWMALWMLHIVIYLDYNSHKYVVIWVIPFAMYAHRTVLNEWKIRNDVQNMTEHDMITEINLSIHLNLLNVFSTIGRFINILWRLYWKMWTLQWLFFILCALVVSKII